MKKFFVGLLISIPLLLGCDETEDIGDLIRIHSIYPNPAEAGDTVTVILDNINIYLGVENLDEV